jgi:hypothetical protein
MNAWKRAASYAAALAVAGGGLIAVAPAAVAANDPCSARFYNGNNKGWAVSDCAAAVIGERHRVVVVCEPAAGNVYSHTGEWEFARADSHSVAVCDGNDEAIDAKVEYTQAGGAGAPSS